MVSKNKTAEKRGKVKVGKLKLNKHTVKDLTSIERKQIKGGANLHAGKTFEDQCKCRPE